MTDVWKSNARRFCEICKVWFADNRVSIEHHEGGQKHKAAIQAKLRELGKQNKQHEKEVAKSDLQATLAMMESAASRSMGIGDSCPSAGIAGPMRKPRKYMDPRAHSASIAEMARQMAQRRKEQELEQKKADYKTENEKCDPESETVWVEARADNGALYYFHMYNGVTVWEQPQNYYTAEQYAIKLAVMENKTDAVASNQVTEPNKLKSELRRHWGQQETAGISKAPKVPQSAFSHDVQDPSTCQSTATNEVGEIPSQKPQIMKFYPQMDATNFAVNECDIPLPLSSENSNQEKLTLNLTKEKSLEESCNRFIQNEYLNFKEENIDIKNETEKVTEEIIEQEEPLQSTPYGPWVPVEKIPERPKVDWELPTEEQGRKRASEPILAPEDLITFSNKSAVIKRKKIDGPIEFRKRKTTIKIRQSIDE
ncbi:U1 zinc finger protein [Wuchereria bancrofti]|uniref:U1 zinc finger protein n=1 Tax=Wuchereria bancrofti TaxID=6293 RepID=J9EH77_WUCBA|nr:U1 zinc finger protein [Wuchereria bancrofti]